MTPMGSEKGQAAVEYALALCLVLVVLLWAPEALLSGLSGYFGQITSLLALPVP